MHDERIIFLGGLLLDEQIDFIEKNSRWGIQYAADALQKAILRGFLAHRDVNVSVVNLPFIGAFPRLFRSPYFPSTTSVLFDAIPVTGIGFLNFQIAVSFFRLIAAERALDQEDKTVIVFYSAHLPFVKAALAQKRKNPNVRVCIVLPDFIEFMGTARWWNKWLIDSRVRQFKKLVPEIDHFVLLTDAMADRLKIGPEKYTVIEGIYDSTHEADAIDWSPEPGPIFIYTGTLAARYGILDLLDAFGQLDNDSAQLWICGDGDASAVVEARARIDNRITYFGRVSRPRAQELQSRAHVMVNPRRPEGEFTRYSFPSKTMEYLASGRPVLMHFLPGIPEEYRQHLITPSTGDMRGLASAMQMVAGMSEGALRQKGAAGRAFVLACKNPKNQIGRMLADLFPNTEVRSTDFCRVE